MEAAINAGGARGLRILGIDPGSQVVGYGCLELAAAVADSVADRAAPPLALAAGNVVRRGASLVGMRVVDAGVLSLGGRAVALEDRLLRLRQLLTELLQRLAPDELAIEGAFYGKSVAAALRIGEARGVILAGAREHGLVVHQFAPARIKRAVAGHGQANKDAVAEMVCRQLALPAAAGPRDITDALAAAYCRAQQGGTAGHPDDRTSGNHRLRRRRTDGG